MTKEKLQELLSAKKITQKEFDDLMELINAGKTITDADINKIIASNKQHEDEINALNKQKSDSSFDADYNKFMFEICNDKIIGKILSKDEVKKILDAHKNADGKYNFKDAVKATINEWATKELESFIGKDAKEFNANTEIASKIQELSRKMLRALNLNDITLTNLPDARILVDILQNDNTAEFYKGLFDGVADEPKYVEVGKGINRTKQLLIKMEEDDGEPIPTKAQINASKSANFSYNNTFLLTDKKFKSYVSMTDGDYVKYFKTGADIVAYNANTIGKMRTTIWLYTKYLLMQQINNAFKLLYAKAESSSTAITNHKKSTKTHMIDALAEYKQYKVESKQFQTTEYCLEKSNMTYAPSTSEWVYIASLKGKTNIEKYGATAINGKAIMDLVGEIKYIPDTIYNPLTAQKESLNIFTDADGIVHDDCILAIEKSAFVEMFNLKLDTSASYPFAITNLQIAFYRGNVELDKTAKCFLFESPALLEDFVIPTKETTSENVVEKKRARK